jgi:hypothetical protein
MQPSHFYANINGLAEMNPTIQPPWLEKVNPFNREQA